MKTNEIIAILNANGHTNVESDWRIDTYGWVVVKSKGVSALLIDTDGTPEEIAAELLTQWEEELAKLAKKQAAIENESPLTPEQHEELAVKIAQAIEKEPQHKEDTMKTESTLAQSLAQLKRKEAIESWTEEEIIQDELDCVIDFEEIKGVFDAITGGNPQLDRIEYNEDAEPCIIGWFDNGDSGAAFYADYGSNKDELFEYIDGIDSGLIATAIFEGYMELAEHVNDIADFDGSMEHITINKPDFKAGAKAASKYTTAQILDMGAQIIEQLEAGVDALDASAIIHTDEESKMRKLKALSDAAETVINEYGNDAKTEKHKDAEVLIDAAVEMGEAKSKRVEKFSAESRNTLKMKFFKSLGDYEVYESSPTFSFNTQTRVVTCWMEGTCFDIVTLADGVSPDKWAMDGRRNWRQFKKFIESVKTGEWLKAAEARWEAEAAVEFEDDDMEEEFEEQEDVFQKVKDATDAHWKNQDAKWAEAAKEAERKINEAFDRFEQQWKEFEKRWNLQPKSNKARLMEILGCKEGDDLKRAYRTFMKANHPDLNPNADLALVQEVNSLMDGFKKGA